MSNHATYVLTWADGEPVGSLLAIDEETDQRRPCGFVRLDDPLLKCLPSHVDTVVAENGLRRVEFRITAFALDDVARRVA